MTEHLRQQTETEWQNMTVYFDGACPLCAREIAVYRRCRGADRIRWIDVAVAPAEALPKGLTRDQVLARFHVRDEHGRIASGAAAFAVLWSALPAFGLLGWMVRRPIMTALLERLYVTFLKHRPRISRMMSGRRLTCAGDARCG